MIKISVIGETQRSREGLGWGVDLWFMSELFVLWGSNQVERRKELWNSSGRCMGCAGMAAAPVQQSWGASEAPSSPIPAHRHTPGTGAEPTSALRIQDCEIPHAPGLRLRSLNKGMAKLPLSCAGGHKRALCGQIWTHRGWHSTHLSPHTQGGQREPKASLLHTGNAARYCSFPREFLLHDQLERLNLAKGWQLSETGRFVHLTIMTIISFKRIIWEERSPNSPGRLWDVGVWHSQDSVGCKKPLLGWFWAS